MDKQIKYDIHPQYCLNYLNECLIVKEELILEAQNWTNETKYHTIIK